MQEPGVRVSEEHLLAIVNRMPLPVVVSDLSLIYAYFDEHDLWAVEDFPAHLVANPRIVAECAPLMRLRQMNRAALDLFELREEDGSLVPEKVFTGGTLQIFRAGLVAMQSLSRELAADADLITPSGTRVSIRYRWLVPPDREAGRLGSVASLEDVTGRGPVERALEEVDIRDRIIVQSLPAVVWRATPEGRCTYVSRGAERVFGYPLHRWTSEEDFRRAHLHPEDREWVVRVSAERTGRNEDHQYEYRMVRADGATVWVRDYAHVLSREGRPVELVGMMLDVTEFKLAEVALRESEERYRRVVEDQTEFIVRARPEGEILFANQSYARQFGTTPEGLVGKSFYPLIAPEDHERVRARIASIRPEAPVATGENFVPAADGRLIWTSWLVRGFFDDAGRVVEIQCVGRDVTEAKAAETALRESEERYRRVVEDQTEFIIRHRPDGVLLFANDSFCRYYGFDRRDVVGGSLYSLIPEDLHSEVREKLARLSPREPTVEGEHLVVRGDGSRRWNRWLDRGLFDGAGNLVEIQSVGRDVTVRREAEASLRVALAEVERLKDRLKAENVYLREQIREDQDFGEILGDDPTMRELGATIRRVADTDATVLVVGETGTGKELVARALHRLSRRRDHAIVKVNCSAVSAGLVESELFGHVRGAFTGAVQDRRGRFEVADGGTIFLDEIGELPSETQVKLLRVLEEREFERVGSSESVRVDVRVIAATNRDLEASVADGTFRSDLFYRLNVFPILVPPLRERASDIPLLAEHFLERISRRLGRSFGGFHPDALDWMSRYDWPGNVRELRNLVERAAILTTGDLVRLARPPGLSPASGAPVRIDLESVERDHIRQTLDRVGWVIEGPAGAARLLGLAPSTLRSRMKKLRIRR